MHSFTRDACSAPFSHLRRRHFLLSMLAAGGTGLKASEPRPVAPSYNTMTDEQEISVGRQMVKSLEKDERLKIINEHSIHSPVNEIFQSIAKSSRRPNMPYSIKVVDTKSVNAFALPGGFVYVFRGLIETSKTESELAGCLAHEVGHVVGRHGANSLCRAKAADSLLSEASRMLLGSEAPAQLLEQLGGPLEALALLKYDRQQELEADLLGFYNMQRAGWDPNGMVRLFKRFDDSSSPLDSLLAFASNHPLPAERQEQIQEEMRRYPVAENLNDDSDSFHRVQSELKRMPPPSTRSSQIRVGHGVLA